MMNYPIFVDPLSEEDGGGYIAFAIDLKGCVGDGDTLEAAVADLLSAIKEWCDEAVRLKRKIPRPHSFSKNAGKERKKFFELVSAQRNLISVQRETLLAKEAALFDAQKKLDQVNELLGDQDDYDDIRGEHWILPSAVSMVGTNRASKSRKDGSNHH